MTGFVQNMLTCPPVAPAAAAGDAAGAMLTLEAAAFVAGETADAAAVVGATPDDDCGGFVGCGAVVAVGADDPPHAASRPLTTAALAAAINLRRVQIACRSLVVIGNSPHP